MKTILMTLHKIARAKKEETIALSNFFSNRVKRAIRKEFGYKTNCYVRID